MKTIQISIISALFMVLIGCASPAKIKDSKVMLKTGEKISRLQFVFLNPEMKTVNSSNVIGHKHPFIDIEKYGPDIESQAMSSFAKYGIGVPETQSVQVSGDESVLTYLKGKQTQTVPMLFLYPTQTTDVSSNLGRSGSYLFTAMLVNKSKQILWLANLNLRTGGGFDPKLHTQFLVDEIAKRLGDDGFY